MQPVVEEQLLPGLRLVGGVPERDDVVGRFVIGRQFDQIDRAFGPATLRLDPDIGTTLVVRRVVLVMIEVAIALQQSEAARILVLVRIEAHPARVGKRPPDPLPLAGPEREAVRIVDLWTPVAVWNALAAAALKVHAGERRCADPLDDPAWIDRGGHVHHEGCTGMDVEPIGSGEARRLEQRV